MKFLRYVLLVTFLFVFYFASDNPGLKFGQILVIVIVLVFAGLFIKRSPSEKPKQELLLNALVALVASIGIFYISANIFVDDAGFVMRYLKNFSHGYFFHFNIQDPPVFGMSGFLYSVVCGFIALFNIFTPHQIIFGVCFVSFVIFNFIFLNVLDKIVNIAAYKWLIWFGAIFGSKLLLVSADNGLETSFHLAVICAALYFFFTDNSKMTWLFLALAVISKLDAVPFAVITGLYFISIHFKGFLPNTVNNRYISDILIFAGIPIVLYLVITILLFGSPLPHSAFAKLAYHPASHSGVFPFFNFYFSNPIKYPQFLVFTFLFTLHLGAAYFQNSKEGFKTTIFGSTFIGTLVLFYIYNPDERMNWYYALPEWLMMAQLGISFIYLAESYITRFSKWIAFGGALCLFLIIFPDYIGGILWTNNYMSTIEGERMQVGKYVKEITSDKDSIIASHGYTSCYTDAYVFDMSGLNSVVATDYKTNTDSILNDYPVQVIVDHAMGGNVAAYNNHNYKLKRAFYDITTHGFPTWLVMEKASKNDAEEIKPLSSEFVKSNGPVTSDGNPFRMKGSEIKIQVDGNPERFIFGIMREVEDQVIEVYFGNQLVQEIKVRKFGDVYEGSKLTQAFYINLKDFSQGEIVLKNKGENQFELLSPALIFKK